MPDDVKIICPKCQQRNLDMAQYCTGCGYSFKSFKSPATGPSAAPPVPSVLQSQRPPGIMKRLFDSVRELFSEDPQPRPNSIATQRMSPAVTRPTPRSQNAPTMRLNENDTPGTPFAPSPIPNGQNIAGQYRVLNTIGLETCNIYEVVSLQTIQSSNLQQPTHLIRETAPHTLHLPLEHYTSLTSQQRPYIMPQQQPLPSTTYTVIQHPGSWGTLAKVKAPLPPEKALVWTEQIAQALKSLNQVGLGGFWAGKEGRESILIVREEARLADITFVRRIAGQEFAQDVYALASLLHYLLTGYELTPEAPQAPPQFRTVLRRAAARAIPAIPVFMEELEASKRTPVYQRALRQTPGYLTHQGKTREHNEDYVGVFHFGLDQTGVAAPVGLYIVADGMGGQAAGELASKDSVRQAFVQFIEKQVLPSLQRITRKLDQTITTTPEGQLKTLVQVANQLVLRANQATNTDRGTTITAALIIGSQAYIANVGDSRTYLLRNGHLKQITLDHSLVYSLFKAGQITEEEIYTHPRKNEVHRSLGDKAEVQVDIFSETLQPGDKLLLCSDGLWEMVRNPYIQQAMTSAATPQGICDHLIRMANDNGGEDNITAIIVALE